MSPELLKAATAYFRLHEGVVDHMYLCVHGRVTAGVGHMFPTPSSARAAGWMRGNVFVAWAEIESAWNRVKRMPFGVQFSAKGFARATDIRLSPQAIDGLLQSDLLAFESGLAKAFPDWDHYPDAAQLGLLDMAFSLGVQGLLKGYPKCVAAAKRQDWATCAAECKRGGVSPTRDAALAALFTSAIPSKKESK